MDEKTRSANDSVLAVIRDKDGAWLKTLYVEAWKQYAHEDALAQARSNVFLVVQAVLLAFLAAISTVVVKIGCATVAGSTINLGLTLLGLTWAVAAMLLLLLATRFQKISDSGQLYVNLRHLNLRALERLAGVGLFGPALMEHALREFKPTDARPKFVPFADYPEFSSFPDLAVEPYSHFGGFTYLRAVIKIWGIVYSVVLIVGIVLFVVGFFGPAWNLDAFVPALKCV